MQADYDCSCWCDYPNENHRYYGCSDTPKKSGKWKCVDCYEYVGKSKFGATHCKRKVEIMKIDELCVDHNALALISNVIDNVRDYDYSDEEEDSAKSESLATVMYIGGVIAMANRMKEVLKVK